MTAATRTADQLLDLLTEAAETGPVIPTPAVAALAWPGHTAETLTAAWMDFREAVRARAAMAGLTRHWTDFYDRGDVGDLDDALDHKSAEIDDLYWVLVNGPRRARS